MRIAGTTTSADPVAPAGTAAEFVASGTVITSPGFLRVYPKDDDEDDEDAPR